MNEKIRDNVVNWLAPILDAHALILNVDKTERIKLGREHRESQKPVKKLGTKLHNEEAVQYRIQQSAAAFGQMQLMWKRRYNISLEAKLRLYRAYIETILTFNLAACPLTRTLENKIDAHHRKQLRRLMDIHYPEHISNAELYEKTGTERISLIIRKNRITTLQHIVQVGKRYDLRDPANFAMQLYMEIFSRYSVVNRKTHTSLLDVMREDFQRITSRKVTLQNVQDLNAIRAWDNQTWRTVTEEIIQSWRDYWQEYDKEHEIQKKRKAIQSHPGQEVQNNNEQTSNNNPSRRSTRIATNQYNQGNQDPERAQVRKKRKTTHTQDTTSLANNRVIVCSPTNVNRVPRRASVLREKPGRKTPDTRTRF
jgi:sulfur relay (sulfurtransferase) DsrC/TusE family protein